MSLSADENKSEIDSGEATPEPDLCAGHSIPSASVPTLRRPELDIAAKVRKFQEHRLRLAKSRSEPANPGMGSSALPSNAGGEVAVGRVIDPSHLADLRKSTLTDETIAAAGLYTEYSASAVAKILGWRQPDWHGPWLIFRFLPRLDGSGGNFARPKPSHPRTGTDGKPVKYEQPKKEALPDPDRDSFRAYFPPNSTGQLLDVNVPVIFCEGEKKCLAVWQIVWQFGMQAIGLTGVWAWQKPDPQRKNGKKPVPRQLIDDLAQIPWTRRKVLIVFDTDSRRNPSVNMAAAELARVLSEHGAIVEIVHLPVGPVDPKTGMPEKVGVDDYILRHGADAFHQVIEHHLNPPAARPLSDYRSEMERVRVESVGTPGVNLDRSPTGAGKTFADMAAMREAKRSLTIVNTHQNCDETVESFGKNKIQATAYPELSKETCMNHDKASKAIESGLSASAAVCPKCPHKESCIYRSQVADAESAAHCVATHMRAAYSFASIANGRRYIAIHEDPTDLLRPTVEILSGLEGILKVLDRAIANARMSNDNDMWLFAGKMEEAAFMLQSCLETTDQTQDLALPGSAGRPRNAEARLFDAMTEINVWPDGYAMRICKAAAAGELDGLAVEVDQRFEPGGKKRTDKKILAVWKTRIPENATVWISDATADRKEIESIVGRPVCDMTPRGQLRHRVPPVQVPVDVTQRSRGSAITTLSAVMSQFPDIDRVGVICHRCHVPLINGTANQGECLSPELQERITCVEYFRGGEGRGSNRWIHECDLLIVLGTPRVPPAAIKRRLLQAGKANAASRDELQVEWAMDYWSGITTTGQRRTIRTPAYRDRDWDTAHRSIVVAELKQCMGRGRGLCENAIPVVVVTTECLGLELLDIKIKSQTESQKKILDALHELTEVPPNIYLLGGTSDKPVSERAVSSPEIAKKVGLTDRQVRSILCDLEKYGFVERVGQRGGWKLTILGRSVEDRDAPAAA